MSEEQDQPTPEDLERDFPSIEPAYDLAVASYDAIARRIDSVDGRLQTVMTFAVSTLAVVPSIGANRGLSFRSGWFAAAVAVSALAIGLGTFARLAGTLKLLDPGQLKDHYVYLHPTVFKSYVISFAAEDFAANNALVKRRWRLTVAVTILFFVEAFLLAIWVS